MCVLFVYYRFLSPKLFINTHNVFVLKFSVSAATWTAFFRRTRSSLFLFLEKALEANFKTLIAINIRCRQAESTSGFKN